MADVEVKCESCGAPVTLSEYAAIETISCRSCGAALRAQPSSPTDDVRERLKLRPQEAPPEPGEEGNGDGQEAGEEEAWRFQRYIDESREAIKEKPKNTALLLSWLVFLILAAAMAYARYFDGIPANYLELIKFYGPYAALVMHFIILLTAFKDTVFQGILCLLIPGYSFFYLFFVSDNFWLRACIAGLMAGIAQDSALFYNDVATDVYRAITDYIASGG